MIHISIEGFDGVGKSTSSELLARKTGFIPIEKPLKYLFDPDGGDKEYLRIRNYMNDISTANRSLSACFYGLGNLYLYERFKGNNIITDRHILSNYAWSGSHDSKPFFDVLYQILGAPTYTFIIYGDEETLTLRLKNRNENDSDIKKIRQAAIIYEKMISFASEHQMPYLLIDTSNQIPETVVDTMYNELLKQGIIKK
jgi:thymidylate kinase